MTVSSAKDRFREVVCGIPLAGRSLDNVDEINGQLRDALLSYGSATPDNTNCVEHVQVGHVPHPGLGSVTGLVTVHSRALLSDVCNALEDLELPEALRHVLPSLSGAEWRACTRMVTMILTALETDPIPDSR